MRDIVKTIATLARERLTPPKKAMALSDKERELQAFFDTSPFDCKDHAAARLVEILTGFRPEVSGGGGAVVGLFEFFDYSANTYMVVTSNCGGYTYGIPCAFKNSHIQWAASNCPPATTEKAEVFLKNFEKWSDTQLVSWIITKLGGANGDALFAAVEARNQLEDRRK